MTQKDIADIIGWLTLATFFVTLLALRDRIAARTQWTILLTCAATGAVAYAMAESWGAAIILAALFAHAAFKYAKEVRRARRAMRAANAQKKEE